MNKNEVLTEIVTLLNKFEGCNCDYQTLLKQYRKELNMGKNIKHLAGSTIFNQKIIDQMNGINKNNKGKASPIYIPTKKRK